MLRQINYRNAATMFVFTALWFVIGLVLLKTPIPGARGIRGTMLVAWLLLLFVILALSGATLTLAAINGIFPAQRGRAAAPPAVAAPAAPPASDDATTDAEGKPLPWTQSPLPAGSSRRWGGDSPRSPARRDH